MGLDLHCWSASLWSPPVRVVAVHVRVNPGNLEIPTASVPFSSVLHKSPLVLTLETRFLIIARLCLATYVGLLSHLDPLRIPNSAFHHPGGPNHFVFGRVPPTVATSRPPLLSPISSSTSLVLLQGVHQAGHSLDMSTSKPTLDSRFVARLARGNDPARKAELDAIAALDLEEPQEQEDENVPRLNEQFPSPSLPGSSHREAQPETQVSKARTHSIGLAAPSSSSATLPAGNGQASSGRPEWPITARRSTLTSVESNLSSSMSQSLHPPHPVLASEIRLPTPTESENHRRTGSHTPGHAEQVGQDSAFHEPPTSMLIFFFPVSTLSRDATFKAQKDLTSCRTQSSVQSSRLPCRLGSWDHFKRREDFITVTGWIGGGNGTFADTHGADRCRVAV